MNQPSIPYRRWLRDKFRRSPAAMALLLADERVSNLCMEDLEMGLEAAGVDFYEGFKLFGYYPGGDRWLEYELGP